MKTKQERAQSMVIFGVALLGLLAFIALATDGGRLYVERRNAQSAADAAALAAARVKIKNGTDDESKAKGQQIAASNGFNNDTTTNTVSVYPSKTPAGDYDVKVVITSTFKTSFLHLFSRNAITNQSTAVVHAKAGDSLLGPNLIVGANETACDTVAFNGNVNITVNGGNILSNSDATIASDGCNSMSKNGISGTITANSYVDSVTGETMEGHIYMVGTYGKENQIITNPPDVTPDPEQTSHYDYPVLPAPSCAVENNFLPTAAKDIEQGKAKFTGSKPAYTLIPGRYTDIDVQSNPTVTLNPGLYCISGDFKINAGAKLIADGVVIVMQGGTIDFSGASSIELKSPAAAGITPFNLVTTSGTTEDYKGIVIYADPAYYDPSNLKAKDFILNGNSITDYKGTIYMPETNCTVNGSTSSVAYDTQLLCNRVSVGGNGSINFTLTKSINQPGSYLLSLIQ